MTERLTLAALEASDVEVHQAGMFLLESGTEELCAASPLYGALHDALSCRGFDVHPSLTTAVDKAVADGEFEAILGVMAGLLETARMERINPARSDLFVALATELACVYSVPRNAS